jgi:hypothetical protein
MLIGEPRGLRAAAIVRRRETGPCGCSWPPQYVPAHGVVREADPDRDTQVAQVGYAVQAPGLTLRLSGGPVLPGGNLRFAPVGRRRLPVSGVGGGLPQLVPERRFDALALAHPVPFPVARFKVEGIRREAAPQGGQPEAPAARQGAIGRRHLPGAAVGVVRASAPEGHQERHAAEPDRQRRGLRGVGSFAARSSGVGQRILPRRRAEGHGEGGAGRRLSGDLRVAQFRDFCPDGRRAGPYRILDGLISYPLSP